MAAVLQALKRVFDSNEREVARLRRRVEEINKLEPQFQSFSDEELRAKTEEFKSRLAEGETLDDILPEAFAAVREAARRTLGQRHFDVQVMGAIVLHEGKIAEMKTGEGKTLTATMPLYLNALTGRSVQLVTTNDYLVRWQADWMRAIYEFLGMSCGYIQQGMDPAERRANYDKDITYVQNSELGFDYLRDNMTTRPENLVLPDLYYAIVDEVDSILIDEARTPLIISGMPQKDVQFYEEIDRIVSRLHPMLDQENEEYKKTHDGQDHPEADYTYDPKFHQAALTEKGQEKVERMLGIDNLSDPHYSDIRHHVDNSLKAHALFERDVDYVIKDNEVVIVDEFTGHLQPGRRYSDGLHQAIEAKEGVRVQQARQTVASITYQNFFRLYEKLAGMTGTAKTEEPEFVQIYNMPVVVIPTNEPVIRKDYPDLVYKTQEAKYRGIVSEILYMYIREQPVLCGSRSVEVSEYLGTRLAPDKLRRHCLVLLCQRQLQNGSDVDEAKQQEYTRILRRPIDLLTRHDLAAIARDLDLDPDVQAEENVDRLLGILGVVSEETDAATVKRYRRRLEQVLEEGIPHNILNAKYHEEEGRIIAQAGRPGQITIATNMAGRGVDIVLGGKPEDDEEQDFYLEQYEKVKRLGGLHIIGTERHESRRIDNQLRGRSGRQGDPGSSRFYVSLEDELMQLFGPDRFGMFLRGWPEEEAIEHRIVSKSIERAQAKVELRNFEIRKNTLKYDDVMDKQRKVIYEQRRQVLESKDVREHIVAMLDRTVDGVVEAYASPEIHPEDRDLEMLYSELVEVIPALDSVLAYEDLPAMDPNHIGDEIKEIVHDLYRRREQAIGPEMMREIERSWLLHTVDYWWMEHLREMDDLRDSIGLRGYGQRDPLVEYQREAYEYFERMIDHIAEDMTRAIMMSEESVEREERDLGQLETSQEMLAPELVAAGVAAGGESGGEATLEQAAAESRGTPVTYRAVKEPDRNDPCPCGSGKKYKKCCMLKKDNPYARRG